MRNVRVGFIGLGLMGRPMAMNILSAGYTLTVWNRTAERMAPLVDAGAAAAGNPAEVAEVSDILFTMLTDGPQVQEVILADNGIVHGARAGSIIIDTSSIAPSVARENALQLAQHGLEMLDAPVSGGPEGAARGTLSIMVGGKQEIFEQVLPILQVLGRSVRYVGPSGMGQIFKLCNQVACALNILAMSEALALADCAGADMAAVREVLLAGAAGSWMLENWGPKIVTGDYTPGFTVANAQKDMRNVLQEAERLGLPLPGIALVQQLWRSNEAAGEGQESNAALFKTIKRLAGEKPQ
jgi:3-hydroxyisobutyrate dehydrogenase